MKSALLTLTLLLLAGCSVLSDTVSSQKGRVTFAVVGDVMAHDAQLEAAYDPDRDSYSFVDVFRLVKPSLSRADLTVGNLETTLPGDPALYAGYPQFGAPDALAEALKETGFDILTTANNHSVDKGRRGIVRTIQVLDRLKLRHLGTYASQKEHETGRVLIVERNSIRFAFLNYTYGTNGLEVPEGLHVNLIDKKAIAEDLDYARTLAPHVIIVLYHFGGEYLRQPDDFQKEMTAFAFQEGADVVLGGHPHVLQPFEMLRVKDRFGITKERLVIYSLGNFVSNQQRRYTDGGIIFHFTVTRNDAGPVQYSDVHYEPVWVYVEKPGEGRKRARYYILPVEEFLAAETDPILEGKARRTMMVFYNDTKEHLAASLDSMIRMGVTSPERRGKSLTGMVETSK